MGSLSERRCHLVLFLFRSPSLRALCLQGMVPPTAEGSAGPREGGPSRGLRLPPGTRHHGGRVLLGCSLAHPWGVLALCGYPPKRTKEQERNSSPKRKVDLGLMFKFNLFFLLNWSKLDECPCPSRELTHPRR